MKLNINTQPTFLSKALRLFGLGLLFCCGFNCIGRATSRYGAATIRCSKAESGTTP